MMDEIIDLLDIAAKDFPIKALADEIDKAESTLRNELTRQPGYKLGLHTAVLIMKKTKDLRALDKIESFFNRVAFVLPPPQEGAMEPIMKMVASMAREFGENMEALAKTLEDGKITKHEATRCLQENKDVITACVKLQAYLEQFVK